MAQLQPVGLVAPAAPVVVQLSLSLTVMRMVSQITEIQILVS